MAEQLGEAVLKLSVDSAALDAGLQRSRQQAGETGTAVEQAFTKTGRALQTAANGLQYFVDANGRARTATGQLVTTAELQAAGLTKLADTAKRAAGSLDALQGPLSGFNGILRNLAGLAGVVGIGALTQQIISTGQASERSKIQLQALAGAYGEAAQAAQSVQRIQAVLGVSALDARQGFAQLYASLRGTGIGLQQLEVLFVGVSNAARLSGASMAEAQGALLQLRQGLASGRLQGDELRSVLENLPVLAQAIAREMGVNVGQIKQLGSEGKITSDIIFNAAKSLALATAPARTQIEQLGIAYTNLKEKAAEAFGPALVGSINTVAAGLAAFANYLKTNREGLTLFAQSIVGIGKTLAPLAAGILTVQAAFKAWAIAVQAVRIAQAGLLALQGPKGWAVLAGGIAATAAAAKLLDGAYKGVASSVGTAKEEAGKALAAFTQLTGQTTLEPAKVNPSQATLTSVQAKDVTAALELQNIRDRIEAAKQLNQLDAVGRLQQENRLQLAEKMTSIEALRVDLAREEAKPQGNGSGENGVQSLTKIANLHSQINKTVAETALIRLEAERTEAQAIRTQQERLRLNRIDAANAEDRLRVTKELIALEQQSALRQTPVSETAKLQLQQQVTLGEELRQQDAARAALATELAKPKLQQDRVVVEDLVERLRIANQEVRQAYADAGLSLVQNARKAADALKSAQLDLQNVLRSGFQYLTPQEQQTQIARARATIQPLVDSGKIATGIDISTPDKLFALAGFAESRLTAEKALQQALNENTAAQKALVNGIPAVETSARALETALQSSQTAIETLVSKDWVVNVNVPGGRASGDVVGKINGRIR